MDGTHEEYYGLYFVCAARARPMRRSGTSDIKAVITKNSMPIQARICHAEAMRLRITPGRSCL